MRQGTTPVHTFTLPCSGNEVKSARITYVQGDDIVLEKALSDCKVDGRVLVLTLSQEETFLFESNAYAEVQVRILLNDDSAYASDVGLIQVEPSLNKEVLT